MTAHTAHKQQPNSGVIATLGFLSRFYTRESLFRLFLVCAFPLHLWTLLMAFRDFGWVAARTYTWDAVGLVSYAMVFALFETIGLFLLVVLLGFLVPVRWTMDKRVALIGMLFLILAGWAILAQLLSSNAQSLAMALSNPITQANHPLRILWATAFLLVSLSVMVPSLLITRLERTGDAITAAFDRLAVLSAFYIFLDMIAIVIIVIRNLLLRMGI